MLVANENPAISDGVFIDFFLNFSRKLHLAIFKNIFRPLNSTEKTIYSMKLARFTLLRVETSHTQACGRVNLLIDIESSAEDSTWSGGKDDDISSKFAYMWNDFCRLLLRANVVDKVFHHARNGKCNQFLLRPYGPRCRNRICTEFEFRWDCFYSFEPSNGLWIRNVHWWCWADCWQEQFSHFLTSIDVYTF